MAEPEEVGDEGARIARKKTAPARAAKPSVSEAGTNAGGPERSDSDESDDSMTRLSDRFGYSDDLVMCLESFLKILDGLTSSWWSDR
ncbi:hypothetical protein R6Q57_010310 [Mikania cordata]